MQQQSSYGSTSNTSLPSPHQSNSLTSGSGANGSSSSGQLSGRPQVDGAGRPQVDGAGKSWDQAVDTHIQKSLTKVSEKR